METLILIYHTFDSPQESVSVDNPAKLSVMVGVEKFQQQLRCLSQLGKRIVSLDHVLSSGPAGGAEDGQVVLTFDDGHRSNWSLAFPKLVEADAVATFYVVAGLVDKDQESMTSPQLREMASHGMLIGSHGLTHRFLPQLGRKEMHQELADSRARLEDILGKPVLDFALPGGHANRAIFEEARECGYRSVATCKVGVHRNGDDPFRLPRVEIRRGLSMGGFRKTFNRGKLFQLQLLEAAKSCLRNTCGLSCYARLCRLGHRCFAINR